VDGADEPPDPELPEPEPEPPMFGQLPPVWLRGALPAGVVVPPLPVPDGPFAGSWWSARARRKDRRR